MIKFLFKIIAGFGFLFGLVFGYLFVFGTTDLRTTEALESNDSEVASLLLQKMADAHKIQNWDSVQTYSVEFEDVFYGEIGSLSSPFAEDSVRFFLNYIPNSFDGNLEFWTGEMTGVTWGIQSWKTYQNYPGIGIKFGEFDDIAFWLPTYQYFMEFPMRIQRADAVTYAGEKILNGKKCVGVLASWKTTYPQKDIDQYLIWLDKETHLVVKLEYTIRDMLNFIRGAVWFEDYQDFEGILLPTKMPVESNLLEKGILHKMKILNFSKNQIPKKELRPNKALAIMGDEKK